MTYAGLPERVDALEEYVKRLEQRIADVARRLPIEPGHAAIVLMCPHCGKNALEPPKSQTPPR